MRGRKFIERLLRICLPKIVQSRALIVLFVSLCLTVHGISTTSNPLANLEALKLHLREKFNAVQQLAKTEAAEEEFARLLQDVRETIATAYEVEKAGAE